LTLPTNFDFLVACDQNFLVVQPQTAQPPSVYHRSTQLEKPVHHPLTSENDPMTNSTSMTNVKQQMLTSSQAPQALDLLRPTPASAAAFCYACPLVGPDGAEQRQQHDEPVPR
jgi:hypothetical protein